MEERGRRLWRTRRRPCRLFAEREEKKRERSEKCSVSNPWNEYRLVFVHFTVRSTRHFVPVRFSEHEEGGGWGWFRRRLLSTKIATRYDEFMEGERKGERDSSLFYGDLRTRIWIRIVIFWRIFFFIMQSISFISFSILHVFELYFV